MSESNDEDHEIHSSHRKNVKFKKKCRANELKVSFGQGKNAYGLQKFKDKEC
jgi:hypothetical protein